MLNKLRRAAQNIVRRARHQNKAMAQLELQNQSKETRDVLSVEEIKGNDGIPFNRLGCSKFRQEVYCHACHR